MPLDCFVAHDCLGWLAEEIFEFEVDGSGLVGVDKLKYHVVRGVAYDVHRGAFAVGDALEEFHLCGVDYETHALLRFVADDFLARKGGVADGEFCDFDFAAGVLNEFGEAVQVSACAVVVYGNNRIFVHFRNCADGVIDALLHFGVGTLHGVEFDVVFVLTCGNATYCAAAHADSVIVAAEYHDGQVGGGSAFDAVLTTRIANAASLHYHLVKTINPAVLLVFEGEQRTVNQRLTKLVAEV